MFLVAKAWLAVQVPKSSETGSSISLAISVTSGFTVGSVDSFTPGRDFPLLQNTGPVHRVGPRRVESTVAPRWAPALWWRSGRVGSRSEVSGRWGGGVCLVPSAVEVEVTTGHPDYLLPP